MVLVNGNDHLLDAGDLPPLRQTQLGQHGLQLLRRYEPVPILVKHLERLRQIRLFLLLLRRLGLLVESPEQGGAQGLMKCFEVVKLEPHVVGFDVGGHSGTELHKIGIQSEETKGFAELFHGDHAIPVPVKEVEDASQTEAVQAGAT